MAELEAVRVRRWRGPTSACRGIRREERRQDRQHFIDVDERAGHVERAINPLDAGQSSLRLQFRLTGLREEAADVERVAIQRAVHVEAQLLAAARDDDILELISETDAIVKPPVVEGDAEDRPALTASARSAVAVMASPRRFAPPAAGVADPASSAMRPLRTRTTASSTRR